MAAVRQGAKIGYAALTDEIRRQFDDGVARQRWDGQGEYDVTCQAFILCAGRLLTHMGFPSMSFADHARTYIDKGCPLIANEIERNATLADRLRGVVDAATEWVQMKAIDRREEDLRAESPTRLEPDALQFWLSEFEARWRRCSDLRDRILSLARDLPDELVGRGYAVRDLVRITLAVDKGGGLESLGQDWPAIKSRMLADAVQLRVDALKPNAGEAHSRPFGLTQLHDAILTAWCGREERRLTLDNVTELGEVRNRETAGRHMRELAASNANYLDWPEGSRKGAALTERGRSRVKQLNADPNRR